MLQLPQQSAHYQNRKCDKESVISEAIKELWAAIKGVELSKQKIAFIQNQEEFLVKEEERKTVEHFFKH